jgi:hypothetical protein
LPGARRRAVLTALIDRIDVGADQIDIHLRATTKPRSCRYRYSCAVPGGRSRCGSMAPIHLRQRNPIPG